jgi:hypothetical protein
MAKMSILNRPYFRDEEAAHSFLEIIVWSTIRND